MLNVSKAFHEAFKDDVREIYVKIRMKDKLYTKSDINSLEYEGGSIVGDNFAIGSTFSNSVKIVFPAILEGIEELDEIKIDIGIKTIPESQIPVLESPARVGTAKVGKAQIASYQEALYEFVPFGTFYINEIDPDRNDNKTTIKAMDGFVFMGGAYESKLEYPAEIREVALEIANLSGMKVNESDFYRLSKKYIAKMEGYTYRQAIGLIAQFEAGYANFDRDGLLTVRRLYDPNYTIEPTEYYQKGLKKNELMYRLGGISCKVESKENGSELLAVGSESGSQINLENKVMTAPLLADIYGRLENLNFYPCTLNWRGNPAIEVGDWVTMTDLQGTRFKMPILTYKMTFAGGLKSTITANVKTTSQSVTERKGSLNQKIEWMKEQIIKAGETSIYRGLDEPPYPKKNDIWFKPNGPDMELWTYEEVSDNRFEWVLQTSTAPNKELAEAIKEATEKGKEAQEAADKAKELAEKAIDGAVHINDKTVFDFAVIKEAYLVDASITSAKIGDLAVNTMHVADAAITSAKIKDLTADKINTGTLNAAKVNVINLNAESITSGKLTAIDISGVNISGSVISGGEIVSIKKSPFINEVRIKDGEISWSNDEYGKIASIAASTSSSSGAIDVMLKKDQSFFLYENEGSASSTTRDVPIFNTTGTGAERRSVMQGNMSFWAPAKRGIEDAYCSAKIEQNGLDIYTRQAGTNANSGRFRLLNDRFEATPFGTGILSLISGTSKLTGNSVWIQGANQINLVGTTRVTGNFSVTGSKNAIHVTRDGVRATPAYEMTESFLGDIGEGNTVSLKRVKIKIDKLFSDCVNTEKKYYVQLTKYSQGDIWVAERHADYFVVESDVENVSFCWEIKAKRRGYEKERLVLQEDIDNNQIEEIYQRGE